MEEDININLGGPGCDGDWIHLAQETLLAGFDGHSIDPSAAIKCWRVLVVLSNVWLLKQHLIPWN
jgi:hypothetical protein